MTHNYCKKKGEEGVALLLALFIITLLSVLVLEFNYSTRVEYHIASGYKDEVLAINIAKAGLYETIALLREDRLKEIEEKEEEGEEDTGGVSKRKEEEEGEKKEVKEGDVKDGAEIKKVVEYPDHYSEDWARDIYMVSFGEGYLSVKVIDESGKININTLVKEEKDVTASGAAKDKKKEVKEGDEQEKKEEGEEETVEKVKLPRKWGQTDKDRTGEESEEEEEEEEKGVEEPARYVVDKKVEKDILRLLETLDVRGIDSEEVTAAIVNWMDSDCGDDTEEDTCKKAEGLGTPKNAPIEVLSELMMIKGVTADLFFGPKQPEEIDLEKTMSRKKKRRRAQIGLRDCLTIYSETKVNVNTAPPEVLTALLEEENESLVREIVSHTKKGYFEDLKQFQEEIGEHIPASFMAKIGVGSDSFQIISEGYVNDIRKRVRAYVHRDEDANIRIVFWRVEG